MSAKSWCYTLNNYNEDEWACLMNLECNYHVIGREMGEKNNTPHLQGYITFTKNKRISALKKLNKRIHWEIAKSREEAINYCMKEDPSPFIADNRNQGHRTDLDDIATMLNNGKSVTEVARSHPGSFIRYHKGIERYAQLVQVQSERADYTLESCCDNIGLPPCEDNVAVILGPSGCGKTQYALAHFDNPLQVSHMDDLLDFKPEEHDGIVFDDMDFHHLPRTAQIHITDWDNKRSIHCRYRTAQIPKHTRKIFTCNEYPFTYDDAIRRRIIVTEVTER